MIAKVLLGPELLGHLQVPHFLQKFPDLTIPPVGIVVLSESTTRFPFFLSFIVCSPAPILAAFPRTVSLNPSNSLASHPAAVAP